MQNTSPSTTDSPTADPGTSSPTAPTLRSPVTPLPTRQARTARIIWGEDRGLPSSRAVDTGTRRMLASEPDRPLALHDSWWAIAVAGVLASATLTVVLWISAHVTVDPVLHTAALFVHLASLVLGFGGVLIADYLVLVWVSGRSTLAEAIAGAHRLHLPIWLGLAGLVASGALLEPNLASTLTRIKVPCVLILTLNGLQALILSRRMARAATVSLAPTLTIWGAATASVSQICWWTAVWIGFWNAEH
ncbi:MULTISPECIES: hypothetical protein [Rhodococcus]|uniref:Uncharacterized protein n=1 Tax=Rhodococcus opacus RKJ300 = JCM 13270 TaxID=1165867 RepID=I0WY48_RHOOP|nr:MULTISPECIES: hypothetical protein [Rhodococcus]EID81314.1 hypothetical protein W59_03506 [Rhodococcus opacus RKJ300 = JCM 13270]KAF0965084.1 hypothetical protein MLGJGCBP_01753 [Rhodococcus sp. T7]QQZ19252.1 hypothetical protein GO592_38130 [Rhodococcus sp. 21391]UOT08024.1 hypothetical protein MPY17_37205 [Rhodococcus opacus]